MHINRPLTTVMTLMSTNLEGPSLPWIHRSLDFEVLSDDGPETWPSGVATKAEQVSGEIGQTAGLGLTLNGFRDLYGCTSGCIFNNSNVRTSPWLLIPATAVGGDILPLTIAIFIRIDGNCGGLFQFA